MPFVTNPTTAIRLAYQRLGAAQGLRPLLGLVTVRPTGRTVLAQRPAGFRRSRHDTTHGGKAPPPPTTAFRAPVTTNLPAMD